LTSEIYIQSSKKSEEEKTKYNALTIFKHSLKDLWVIML